MMIHFQMSDELLAEYQLLQFAVYVSELTTAQCL